MHDHLRLVPYLLRNAFMRRLQINKYSAMLPTGRVQHRGRSGSFLLYMNMLNVSHASPALQGHYEHLCETIYRGLGLTIAMFSHETNDPSNQS